MEASALRQGTPSVAWPPLRGRSSDDRLVAALRAGRTAAFSAIYERYSAPLLSFCRHMLGSREEAEDAVQHTFAAAYDHLLRSDKPIQLRPWLYAIARNHCVSLLRARRQHVSIDDVEPAVEGLAPSVARREDLREVLRDLARLPEDQRAALLLSELDSFTHEEIGQVVGCRKEKVKALVFQARSSLAASREARQTPCTEIREQLANLSGGSLLRTGLRRHLRDCAGCREFRAEVQHQRQAMAILLPVVPTAALKSAVLSGAAVKAGAGGMGAGAAGGGGVAATGGGVGAVLANAGAAKLVAAGVLAVAGAGGTVTAVSAIEGNLQAKQTPNVSPVPGSAAATPASLGVTPSGVVPTRGYGVQTPGTVLPAGVANGLNPKGRRGRSGTAPGHTGTAPGLAGTAPGLAGTTPGKNGTAPGQAKGKSPGSPATSPGQANPKSNGNSGSAPGTTKTRPGGGQGTSGSGQGNSDGTTAPGSSGVAPGITGTSPGQIQDSPGQIKVKAVDG